MTNSGQFCSRSSIYLSHDSVLRSRAQAGESVPSKLTPAADLSDEESQPKARSKGKGNFAGFAALQMDDTPEPAAAAEEEEDFGGLMVSIILLLT